MPFSEGSNEVNYQGPAKPLPEKEGRTTWDERFQASKEARTKIEKANLKNPNKWGKEVPLSAEDKNNIIREKVAV